MPLLSQRRGHGMAARSSRRETGLISSGIKLAEKTGPADGDEYLESLKQLGMEYV